MKETPDLYCSPCLLQFGKKSVFDLHLSLLHGKNKVIYFGVLTTVQVRLSKLFGKPVWVLPFFFISTFTSSKRFPYNKCVTKKRP